MGAARLAASQLAGGKAAARRSAAGASGGASRKRAQPPAASGPRRSAETPKAMISGGSSVAAHGASRSKSSPAGTSIISPSGKMTLTIGGTNLTDKRYITTGQPQIAGGVIFGTYNPPRQWYATLGVRM